MPQITDSNQASVEGLTDREVEVLHHATKSQANKAIGRAKDGPFCLSLTKPDGAGDGKEITVDWYVGSFFLVRKPGAV